MSETAWDGWAKYQCRIESKQRRGKTVYRYVIERQFIRWEDCVKGWWNKDLEKVKAKGLKKLQSYNTIQEDHTVEGHL